MRRLINKKVELNLIPLVFCGICFLYLSACVGSVRTIYAKTHSNSYSLKQDLRNSEGVHRYVYKCPTGYYTIGVGRNVDRRGKRGLTYKEIDMLLDDDIADVKGQLIRYDWYDKLNNVRKNAIIEMSFNLGVKGVLRFKNMIKALESDNYKKASQEALSSLWAKQVKGRALRIAAMIKYG